MLENYINRLGILVSIYGVWQLLGGIGLIWFNLQSLDTATEIQKSSESFGVGVILSFLIGSVLIGYSIFILSAGIKVFQKNKNWHLWATLVCLPAALQTFFVGSWVVSIVFSEYASLEFLIGFCLVLSFPIHTVVAIYGWGFLLTKNKEIMARKTELLQN